MPYGRLYTIFSVKWIFISAVIIFEAGSVICAAASSSAVLILGRTVAGVGGTGIFSGSLIIAAHCVPLRYRPVYTGAIGALSGIAAIAGPPLGGALTDRASWRWCFWINLPFGVLTAATVLFLTPAMATPKAEGGSGSSGSGSSGGSAKAEEGALQRLARLDFLGMATIIPATVCCLLALQWGGTVYAWDSTRIVALFMTSFVLLCSFVGIQMWKKDEATLPPRIMKNRNIIGAVWFSVALGASFFIVVYYVRCSSSHNHTRHLGVHKGKGLTCFGFLVCNSSPSGSRLSKAPAPRNREPCISLWCWLSSSCPCLRAVW